MDIKKKRTHFIRGCGAFASAARAFAAVARFEEDAVVPSAI